MRASEGAKAIHVHRDKITEMLEKGITTLVLEADKIELETTGLSRPKNLSHTGHTIRNVNLHLQTPAAEDECQIQVSGETI
jgi:hypothetical protein